MSKEKLKLFIESVVAETITDNVENTIKDVIVDLFDSYSKLQGIDDVATIEEIIVNDLVSLPQFTNALHSAAEELATAGLNEAKYHGRTVPLNKRMQGDVKKFTFLTLPVFGSLT